MEEVVNIKVDVSCNKCGSENVTIPETQGSLDPIVCSDCGAELGTRRALDEEIKVQLEKQVADEFQAMLRKTFNGDKNIRLK